MEKEGILIRATRRKGGAPLKEKFRHTANHGLIFIFFIVFVLVNVNYFYHLPFVLHFSMIILAIAFLYLYVQPVWIATFPKAKRTIIYMTTGIGMGIAVLWNVEHLYLYGDTPVFELYFLPILFASLFLNAKTGYSLSGVAAVAFIASGISFESISTRLVLEGMLLFVINSFMVFLTGLLLEQRDTVANKKNFLIDHSESFILGIDNEGKIDLCNIKMAEFLDVPQRDDILGTYFWKMEKELHDPGLHEIFTYLHEEGNDEKELEIEKNGHRYVFLIQSYYIKHDGFVGGRSIVMDDITERKEMEEQLEQLAATDPLTSLYNRRFFEKKFAEEIIRAEQFSHPLSLIVLDIDFFKKVNDEYGHSAGDQVLKKFAAVLEANTRKTDVTSRLGGEEFAILFPETDEDDVQHIAERLQKKIRAISVETEGEEICVTSSIGVITSRGAMTLEGMVQKADEALYRAKEEGRDMIRRAELKQEYAETMV